MFRPISPSRFYLTWVFCSISQEIAYTSFYRNLRKNFFGIKIVIKLGEVPIVKHFFSKLI